MSLNNSKLVEIILNASISITSILIGILAFTLAQYETHKKSPTYIVKPYRYSIYLIIIIVIIGSINSFAALLYMKGILPNSIQMNIMNLLSLTFVLLILSIMMGTIYITYIVMRD